MNIDQLREYCLSKKQTTEGFPFNEDTLVFKILNKMFALVPLDKWENGKASITLKCDPEYALELRQKYESVYAGPYVSNIHWNTVSIYTGELQPEFIFELIDHSYDMVIKAMPKKLKNKLI